MIICSHCDWINSHDDLFCARCRETLKPQAHVPPQSLQTSVNPVSNIERNVIVACCVLSLLLFFFPLMTIQVPIAGAQDVSGYDVFSKLTQFQEKLKSSDSTSQPKSQVTLARESTPDLPASLMLAWLTPLALIMSFVCAGAAIVLAFKALNAAKIFCVIGAVCAGFSILHITIMNSDMHSWIAESMKQSRSNLKGNPFAGLAEGIGELMMNAFQMSPGWGTYALLLLLSLASILGFSRVLTRLRIAPMQ